MKRLVTFVLCAALCLPAALARAADNEEAQAIEAATKWLALCDAGRYAESWREASSFFRGAITEAAWTDALSGIRKPLGAVNDRTRQSSVLARSLPGAPDGSYVVLTYHTVFANKANAMETVTFMLDKDGSWRAAGYFIK
jgi:opacity protein-like surface antigen